MDTVDFFKDWLETVFCGEANLCKILLTALVCVMVCAIEAVRLYIRAVPMGWLGRICRWFANLKNDMERRAAEFLFCTKIHVSYFERDHFQISRVGFLRMSKEHARKWCKAVVKPNVKSPDPEDQELYDQRCAILDSRLHMNGLELSTASKEDLIAQLAPGELKSMAPYDLHAYMLALIISDHVKMLDSVQYIQEQPDPTAFRCRLRVEAIKAAKLRKKNQALNKENQSPQRAQVHQSEPQPLPSDSSASAPGPSNAVQEKEEGAPLLGNDPSPV